MTRRADPDPRRPRVDRAVEDVARRAMATSTAPGLARCARPPWTGRLVGRLWWDRSGDAAAGDSRNSLSGRLAVQTGDRLGRAPAGRAGPHRPGRPSRWPPATLASAAVAVRCRRRPACLPRGSQPRLAGRLGTVARPAGRHRGAGQQRRRQRPYQRRGPAVGDARQAEPEARSASRGFPGLSGHGGRSRARARRLPSPPAKPALQRALAREFSSSRPSNAGAPTQALHRRDLGVYQ